MVIIVAAVVVVVFSTRIRAVILCLWLAGLAIGGVYTLMGAEMLGFIQMITASLTGASLFFFSMIFGEKIEHDDNPKLQKILHRLAVLVGSAMYSFVLGLGFQPQLRGQLPDDLPFGVVDMNVLGGKLTHDYVLSFQIIALTFLIILIGGGVLARAEKTESES
jgi:NADH:ubiquinone oxidoreductase subunit 6 (subunit J)